MRAPGGPGNLGKEGMGEGPSFTRDLESKRRRNGDEIGRGKKRGEEREGGRGRGERGGGRE